MNKSEFIRAYADNLGVTIKDAEKNFNAFLDTLTDPGGSEAKIRPAPVCPAAGGMWSGYEAFF